MKPRRQIQDQQAAPRKRAKTGGSVFALRADTASDVKTSVLFHGFSPRTAKAAEARAAAKARNHRPLLFSPKGTARTPGQTKMYPKDFGPFTAYTSKGKTPRRVLSFNAPEVDSSFFSSDAYSAVKAIQDDIKVQTIHIDKSLLDETRSQGKRKRTQNQVMAARPSLHRQSSATQYTKATCLFEDHVRWEWLHLVAHMIAGQKTQDHKNLVSGTTHANTDMMLAEGELRRLSELFPEGFELSVHATLIPETHIAKEIAYTIKIGDLTLPFKFDAQTQLQSHYEFKHYIRTFIDTVIQKHQTTRKETL